MRRLLSSTLLLVAWASGLFAQEPGFQTRVLETPYGDAFEQRGVIAIHMEGALVVKRFVFRGPVEASDWNRRLLIGAHGGQGGESYSRDGQVTGTDETALDDVIADAALARGYAYASVDRDGIGGTREGLRLTRAFTDLARARSVETWDQAPEKIYLAGLSMGGGVARYAAEETPPGFDGALLIAGAAGDAASRLEKQVRLAVLWQRVNPAHVPRAAASDLQAYADAVGTPVEARRFWPFIGTSSSKERLRASLETYGIQGLTDDEIADFDVAAHLEDPRFAERLGADDTTGRLSIPTIEVVGTFDDFVLREVLVYRDKVEREQRSDRHRLYQVAGAWHISNDDDAISSFQFIGSRMGLSRESIDAMATGTSYLPAVRDALELLDDWVSAGVSPPPNRVLEESQGLVESAALVLLHGHVLDGTGGDVIDDGFIEIQSERITRVGHASEYQPGAEARTIDVSGKWIVPGYIDTHTHLFDSGSLYTSPDDFDLQSRVPHAQVREEIRGRIQETLDRYLCAGVTTVASLGGPRWEVAAREEAAARVAPTVLTAGPFLANFPVGAVTLWTDDDPVLVQLSSVAEAQAWVATLVERRVDLVKVGMASAPGFEVQAFAPILEALVSSAHAANLRVAAHAEALEAARVAVAAGVDLLAHTVVDARLDDVLLEAARSAGVASISGLAHFDRYAAVLRGDAEATLLPIERRCGEPEAIASWAELEAIPEGERPPMPASIRWGSSDEASSILASNLRRLYEAGVSVVAGSNGGNIGTLQGPSYHRELHAMADAGMPLHAVVVSATSGAARALGLEDRGTIAQGKIADLVVLAESPLESVDSFAAIDFVVSRGRLAER